MGRVYISAPRTEGPSVYQWSVPEKKNKYGGWGNTFLNTPVKLCFLENSGKLEGHSKWACIKVCYTPWTPIKFITSYKILKEIRAAIASVVGLV